MRGVWIFVPLPRHQRIDWLVEGAVPKRKTQNVSIPFGMHLTLHFVSLVVGYASISPHWTGRSTMEPDGRLQL